MNKDFENRNIHNSKGSPARIRNGFIEAYNITALIARCEKDPHAEAEITDAHSSGQDEKEVVIDCPCLAHYILETIQKFDARHEDGTVIKAEQIPDDSRKRLEKSWIKIMQQGNLTYGECHGRIR